MDKREVMKLKPIATISFVLTFITVPAYSADCSDAYSYADDSYVKAKRGYNSDNLDDTEYYAKKAMSAAEDAMLAAEDCGCDDAYSAAVDAYSYARKADQAGDYDDAIEYLRKAKSSADDAMSYADDCGT
jgi:tetratricopeptide (TPR) repeat protein